MARFERQYARLVPMRDGSLAYYSSYDPGLVAALKVAVPSHSRRWDPDEKCWRIAADCAQQVADVTQRHLGIALHLPTQTAIAEKLSGHLVEVRYIGATKDRGQGDLSAFGFADGGWNVMFPLRVIRGWFEPDIGDAGMAGASTHYGVLGVHGNADAVAIKTAYRRAARQWHPDVCQEPDAAERFRAIQTAYETLIDPQSKRRYDSDVALASLVKSQVKSQSGLPSGWRPPLRCGLLLVDGERSLGRIVVSRILAWEDIIRHDGRVLITHWPMGADTFMEQWI